MELVVEEEVVEEEAAEEVGKEELDAVKEEDAVLDEVVEEEEKALNAVCLLALEVKRLLQRLQIPESVVSPATRSMILRLMWW